MRKLLFWLQGKLPTRHISHNDMPYMERSYVGTAFGVRVYLHRFVASDEDGLHSHPWRASLSLILAGWYYEDLWSRRVVRRFFNYIGPDVLHRVVLPKHAQHDVWTLFFHTARNRPWGALRPIANGVHGPILRYDPLSDPTDPAFSNWHLTAPRGAALRKDPSLNIRGPAFSIPLGQNAYAAGLATYPDSALVHSLQVDPATLPDDPSKTAKDRSSMA